MLIYPAAFLKAQHGLAERNVSGNNFAHPGLDLLQLLVGDEIYARAAVLHRTDLANLAV